MNDSNPYSPTNRGFTLIELCVVMVIIMVLCLVIIPSVYSAIKTARSSMCLSNLRQIGVGLIAYANEHDQCFPMPSSYGNPPKQTAWIWDLIAYLNMPVNSMGYAPLPRSAGIFICPGYKSRGDRAVCYGLNGYITDSNWNMKILAVPSQSDTFLLGEIDQNTECAFPSNSSYANTVRRHPHNSANFLFVDGHAENISGGIPYTDRRWRWWQ
ncbi:MAG: hypothetical protein B9S32_05755 [Verrucomicrobia bacterium Tous-C9LFEB]|nr:MAG: hypothetical protein B9S32_05755 [Verrucomicrobia bacterium Tous-C9LFEB]